MVSPGADVPSWSKVWLAAGHRRIAERSWRRAGFAVVLLAGLRGLVKAVFVDLNPADTDQFIQVAGAGVGAQGVVLGIGELAGCTGTAADGAQHGAVTGGDHAGTRSVRTVPSLLNQRGLIWRN